MARKTPEQRFKEKTKRQRNGCILWTAAQRHGGYGVFWLNGKREQAHRAAWILFKGPIPPNRDIDHKCRNRLCVNVGHLRPVTHKVNVLIGESFAAVNAAKTHCPEGHPLSGDNLAVVKSKGATQRVCRECHKIRQKKYRARKKLGR